MLVLTRKSGEGVRIGDKIRVVVLEIRERQVKLGFEAPPELGIYREEIFQKIERENIRAARLNSTTLDKLADLWRKDRSSQETS